MLNDFYIAVNLFLTHYDEAPPAELGVHKASNNLAHETKK